MRKFALNFAGLLAMSLLTWDVSATAMFSRQTGMACSSCHFQHFPLLNGFGRAFKSSGFSMMGAQTKVESADLSIPATLNMSVLATVGYEKSDRAKAGALASSLEKNSGDGQYYVPGSGGELSLSFGGRVSENAGFLAELSSAEEGGTSGSAKMPMQLDLSAVFSSMQAGTRIGLIPFATDVLGVSYGFETLNTGANAVHLMSVVRGLNNAHSGAVSAQQYLGTNGAAKGLAFVVSHPNGFINISKYDGTGLTHGKSVALSSSYVRVAGFVPLMGWEAVAFGAQIWSGGSAMSDPAGLLPLVMADTKAYAFDAQLQGHVDDMPLGIYASYARAPVVAANPATGHVGNAFNTFMTQDGFGNPVWATGTKEKSAVNLAVELGLIPDVATFGVAVRRGINGNGLSDNAVFLSGTYQVAQNILLSLLLTNARGDYWYSDPVALNGTTDQIGKTSYTINLSSIF